MAPFFFVPSSKEIVVSVCGYVRTLIVCHFMVLCFYFFSVFLFFSYCDELVKKFMWYFTAVIFLWYICLQYLQFIPAVAAQKREKKNCANVEAN